MNTLGTPLSRLSAYIETPHRWPAGARLATCFSASPTPWLPGSGSACGSNSLALEHAPSCIDFALFTFPPKTQSRTYFLAKVKVFSLGGSTNTICAQYSLLFCEKKTNSLKCSLRKDEYTYILIQGVSLCLLASCLLSCQPPATSQPDTRGWNQGMAGRKLFQNAK